MKFSLSRFPTFSFSHFPLCSLCLRSQGFLSFPASSLPRLLTSSPSRLLVFLVAAILFITQAHAQGAEIPDPNLREVIREALQLPDGQPVTQKDMEQLTHLDGVDRGIADLTGLEHATSLRDAGLRGNQIVNLTPLSGLIRLESLSLDGNPMDDISPLANLVNLKYLYLNGHRRITDVSPLAKLTQLKILSIVGQAISDISPLANLINLTELFLRKNYITDISPLANLSSLRILTLNWNPIDDLTPLQGLNLVEFRYDEICDVPPVLPSVRERIENRSFPSVFQAWDDVVGLDHLTWEQRNVLHDLHWRSSFDHLIQWNLTSAEPTRSLATSLAGPLDSAHKVRQRRLDQNPNMIFLGGFNIHDLAADGELPPDSDFWLRDADGEIVRKRSGTPLVNFLKSEVQDLFMKRIIALDRCGLYDGAMFDGFNHNGTGFVGRYLYPYSDEEIIQAQVNIFREARKHIRDDFLILFNANRSKSTRFLEYINGTYMETGTDYMYGYTHKGLAEIESTLLWSEENFRSPQINCLEGWGIPAEPPDSRENRRWMRVFTTMSLTHSDGYVMYNTGTGDVLVPGHDYLWYAGHEHLWYPFWDANLGRPNGEKAQTYQNTEGLFIREFTNGWAVYNRSGKTQPITLPRASISVSSNKQDITHLLPDLDGEIYLRKGKPFDLNRDGTVNVLDLILVSQQFGTLHGDINGDGTTDLLDLTLVAQQFSK